MLQKKSRLGTRIIYGGHIISLAHALSFDGLENVMRILALERRRAHQPDVRRRHALRLDRGPRAHRPRPRRRGRAAAAPRRRQERRPDTKDRSTLQRRRAEDGRERYHPNVVLDLDYTVLMPKRP